MRTEEAHRETYSSIQQLNVYWFGDADAAAAAVSTYDQVNVVG